MRILFVVPGGNDLGGIITSTEQYVAGLKEAGHDVTFMTAAFTKMSARTSIPRGKYANDFTRGPGTGELYHTTQGWRGEHRESLMNADDRARFIQIGKQHDIVIWASMYGFRNPGTEGQSDWVDAIRKLRGKHIFMIHDDHIRDRYPWAFALAKYARAFVGVQPCSYDSLAGVAAPRAMVYTPLPPIPKRVRSIDDRSGFFMCQVWKGWKNGDRLVAAAPYMPKNSISFAGDGIALRYMRSPDKCPSRWEGLWDAAMKKQKYLGVINEGHRDMALQDAKFLVDLSVRHNSGQYNRIVQEAMAQGCVVIADPRFIEGNAGKSLFKAGEHYFPIFAELGREELAETLMAYDRIDARRYAKVQRAARAVLGEFDRVKLAKQLMCVAEFSHDEEPPLYTGSPLHKDLLAMGQRSFREIFGGEV